MPAALRDAGWEVLTLADVYGESAGQRTPDAMWLEYAGKQGLAVLMLDKKIQHRYLERQALVINGVNAFCLTSGNLDGRTQAERFLENSNAVFRVASHQGPSLHMISKAAMRRVELDPLQPT